MIQEDPREIAYLMVNTKARYFTQTAFIVTQHAYVTHAKEEIRKRTCLVEGVWQDTGDEFYSSEKNI